ncbi:hypothetical protein CL634_07020 [bacterium]|nr:hypothetical protein [bacterium]
MEKGCSICKKDYKEDEEAKDKSACPECVLEYKDKEHRLRNSNWNKFEAKWFTPVEVLIISGILFSSSFVIFSAIKLLVEVFKNAPS